MQPRFFTTHDVATMLGLDPSTISKWIDKGSLLAFRTPGGHRRVRDEDLKRFIELNKMPVPAELGGNNAVPPQTEIGACSHDVLVRLDGRVSVAACQRCRTKFQIKKIKEA